MSGVAGKSEGPTRNMPRPDSNKGHPATILPTTCLKCLLLFRFEIFIVSWDEMTINNRQCER